MKGTDHERHGIGDRKLGRPWHPRGLRRAALVACLLLTACATTSEPKIVVKEVKVPVPVPCPIDTTEPAYVDTLDAMRAAAAEGADALVALVLGGREQRIAWGEGVKKQAGACRPPP